MKFITSLVLFYSIINLFTIFAQKPERAVKKIENGNFNKFALVIGNSNYRFTGS